MNQLEHLDSELVVKGFPMTTPAILLAAMVIRLGGRVELTATELLAAQGLIIAPKPSENLWVLEANTDPVHGVLSSPTLEE